MPLPPPSCALSVRPLQANVLTPAALAAEARAIAARHGDGGGGSFACEVLTEDAILARGMGAYWAVGKGSEPGASSPHFIHLTYTSPPGSSGGGAGAGDVRRVCLVGKGLTFDSGGYNLKAGAGSMIELMKFDMGGAAAVLGAADAIGRLQVKSPPAALPPRERIC